MVISSFSDDYFSVLAVKKGIASKTSDKAILITP
jgi:hypothetical protein